MENIGFVRDLYPFSKAFLKGKYGFCLGIPIHLKGSLFKGKDIVFLRYSDPF